MSEPWTATPPSEPGWWWWRRSESPLSTPEVVHVTIRGGDWGMSFAGFTGRSYLEGLWGPRIPSAEELVQMVRVVDGGTLQPMPYEWEIDDHE